MDSKEKILVLYDTYYPEVNDYFKSWLAEFKLNIQSAVRRIPGPEKEFIFSSDLVEHLEEIPEIQAKEYDYYLILIHEEISRTTNLKGQFEQLLTYLKGLPEHIQKRKTTLIFLREIPLDQEILQVYVEKIVKFYSESGFDLYNQTELINSSSREYWDKILSILDIISYRIDHLFAKREIRTNPAIIFLGRTTPDLESQRELLSNELAKLGIEVLPEPKFDNINYPDNKSLVDVLEYSDLIIQLIGGSSGSTKGNSKKTDLELEYDTITQYLSGEIKRSIGLKKSTSRVIWLPDSIDIKDNHQEEFIVRIKKQLGYSGLETELITGSFEQLKAYISNSLKTRVLHKSDQVQKDYRNHLYLIHEHSTYQKALDLAFQLRTNPIHIVLTHDLYLEKNFIRSHLEALQTCDAVLIYYGLNNVYWYESMVKDIMKVNWSERKKPFRFKGMVYDDDVPLYITKYEEFLYLRVSELLSKEFFNGHLKKIVG
ncbi:MAG TPA: hypothetical protein ENI20_14940 [Bacteroides sp.]|nr:hypothetical protein [Bacteroides sp.]